LIGRSFYDTTSGPEEFAYIPDDFLPLLEAKRVESDKPLGKPARSAEHDHIKPVSGHILADACTLLAGRRMGLVGIDAHFFSYPGKYPVTENFLIALLDTADLLGLAQRPFAGTRGNLPVPANRPRKHLVEY
jgi:hypothetical protein